MEKILISACLVGDNVKYDGTNNKNPLIDRLLEKYELIPFCPEVEGGLLTPRLPFEIIKNKVINSEGYDGTHHFEKGADLAYNICLHLNINLAILKDKSPSCGVNQIYDGTFSHQSIKGMGVTAKLLKSKGVRVISENEIESLLNE